MNQEFLESLSDLELIGLISQLKQFKEDKKHLKLAQLELSRRHKKRNESISTSN